ncbi:MAG TPA: hypothetical protein VFR24_05525 [Candidatus Angelobacter sp.]|nr:hypothetical protein [Candidatus Angelobacter sp.]
MRRTFALIIGALFERQLRFWLSERLPNAKKDVENATWPQLVKIVDRVDPSIRANVFMNDLENLWLIANAVRHVNGRSAERLLKKQPTLWQQTGMRSRSKHDLIGNMRIDDAQIQRYATAVMRFWHLTGASSLP